jgi:tetratricopeptide (TPR) repeat protein
LFDDQRRFAGAEAAYLAALEVLRAAVAAAPAPANRARLGGTLKNLAAFYQDHGQAMRSTAYGLEAVDTFERLAADHPDVPAHRLDLAGACSNLALILHVAGKLTEEEELLRKAVRLGEALVREHPYAIDYVAELGSFEANLGQCLRDQKKTDDALAAYVKAINRLEELLKVQPRHGTARMFLGNAYAGRARTLSWANRHAEALPDWDKAVALAGGPRKRFLQLNRATSQLAVGDYAMVVEQVSAMAADPTATPDDVYNAACNVAQAADLVKKADKLPPADRDRQADEYAARAVGLLRRAAERGFRDVEHLKADKDLDGLRGRDDYKALLAGWPGTK